MIFKLSLTSTLKRDGVPKHLSYNFGIYHNLCFTYLF